MDLLMLPTDFLAHALAQATWARQELWDWIIILSAQTKRSKQVNLLIY